MSEDKGKRARTDVSERKRETTVSKKDKRERVRLSLQDQSALSCEKEPGFHYRWVNDLPGRIASRLKAGWEFVEDDVQTTYSSASIDVNQRGQQVWRVVNVDPAAPCREAALMRIPQHMFDEDQQVLQDKIDQEEQRIDPSGAGKQANQFGSMRMSRGKDPSS